MPYIDVQDPDGFVHLLQLFVAAHPHYRAMTEEARVTFDQPGEYFLSLPMFRDLVPWARRQHLITRKHADMLTTKMRLLLTLDPGEVVTITDHTRGPGAPGPRTVQWHALFRWLYMQDPGPEDPQDFPVLLRQVPELIDDLVASSADRVTQARATLLREWLQKQGGACESLDPCFLCENLPGQQGDWPRCPACGGTAKPGHLRRN